MYRRHYDMTLTSGRICTRRNFRRNSFRQRWLSQRLRALARTRRTCIVTCTVGGRRLASPLLEVNPEKRSESCVCVCCHSAFPGFTSGLARVCPAQGLTSELARVCPEDRACCDSWCFLCCLCGSRYLGWTTHALELPFLRVLMSGP